MISKIQNNEINARRFANPEIILRQSRVSFSRIDKNGFAEIINTFVESSSAMELAG